MPKSEVKGLKRSEAAKIYKALYWDVIKCNQMPAGLDLALFDYGVNSGPTRAVKELQALLKIRRDGAVGPITLGAIRHAANANGAGELAAGLCDRRLSFLKSLSSFAVFGRGWTRRVSETRALSLQMASANPAALPKKRKHLMDVLSGYKTYIVGALMLIAGIAQAAGIDIPGFDGYSAGQLIMEGFAVVFLRKGLKSDIANA